MIILTCMLIKGIKRTLDISYRLFFYLPYKIVVLLIRLLSGYYYY